nr:MAG TPA: hypothetical protein [Caudoviricetes sp.]
MIFSWKNQPGFSFGDYLAGVECNATEDSNRRREIALGYVVT